MVSHMAVDMLGVVAYLRQATADVSVKQDVHVDLLTTERRGEGGPASDGQRVERRSQSRGIVSVGRTALTDVIPRVATEGWEITRGRSAALATASVAAPAVVAVAVAVAVAAEGIGTGRVVSLRRQRKRCDEGRHAGISSSSCSSPAASASASPSASGRSGMVGSVAVGPVAVGPVAAVVAAASALGSPLPLRLSAASPPPAVPGCDSSKLYGAWNQQ